MPFTGFAENGGCFTLAAFMTTVQVQEAPVPNRTAHMTHSTVMAVLYAISFSHLLNDTIQALLPSIYPMLRDSFNLKFAELGWITFTFQCTASLFQALTEPVQDRTPPPPPEDLTEALAAGNGRRRRNPREFTLPGLAALLEGACGARGRRTGCGSSAGWSPARCSTATRAGPRNRGAARSAGFAAAAAPPSNTMSEERHNINC